MKHSTDRHQGQKPLLTIAIPTWNRAVYLAKTLEQLRSEIASLTDSETNTVEILVSDNGSDDNTQAVVEQALTAGCPINYVRNPVNMGSDVNIAQCFNLATGKYVLILGDDDLLVDHALATVLAKLAEKNYGIVCMRAYGFNHDFRREYPGNFGDALEFTDSAAFLTKINSIMTFISSCIINREILSDVDAMAFCGGNLVQVHLVVQAAIRSKQNFFFNSYLIACQRNNSGGYDFSTVFVRNLGAVLDNYQSAGLNRATIMAIENQLLLTYYPFYILRQRLTNSGNLAQCQADFIHRFQGRALFSYWISPIITLPRPCAIMWGIMATLIGRTLNGDLQRGIRFGWSRLTRT